MILLKQMILSILFIFPIPLWMCLTGGHVGVMFMLVAQVLIAWIYLTVYFCITAKSFGISLSAALGRGCITSCIFAFATILEWQYADAVSSVVSLLYGKNDFSAEKNLLFLSMMLLYSIFALASSIAISYWGFKGSAENH